VKQGARAVWRGMFVFQLTPTSLRMPPERRCNWVRQAVSEGHRDVERHRDARQSGQSDAISSAHCEANAMFCAVRLNDLLASVVIC